MKKNEINTPKEWDERFLRLAKEISTWSKDPSTQVGAVVVDVNRHIVATGYNGFPPGIRDDERLESRSIKYDIVIHAEENCIIHGGSLVGCTIYTYPLLPCSRCASKLIASGIRKVVSVPNDNERWIENINLSIELFREAGVFVHVRTPDGF